MTWRHPVAPEEGSQWRWRPVVGLLSAALITWAAGCNAPGGRIARTPAPHAGAPEVESGLPVPTLPQRPEARPPDSLRADAPPPRPDTTGQAAADSARVADSLAQVASGATARQLAVRDSSARADSIASAEAARKKMAPTTRTCVLDFTDSPPETRLTYSRMSDEVANTFIGGGFVGHCQGENNRISADSAEQFQAPGIVNLYGNVRYDEPGRIQITAAHATYFTREGRLYADGTVTATHIGTGSSFSGPTMEYYRVMPDRPVARMIAPSRSTARVIEKDSLGRLGPPTVIVADRFEDAGDSVLMAWGDVVIDREQLNGRADSSSFDKTDEKARLMRGARITNSDTTRSFTLVGDTIDMYSANRQLNRVVAIHKASSTSSEMLLEAERIDLRLDNQELTEAFAYGGERARAHTPQQDVEADSLRIRIVDQRVREVNAIGKAVATGVPDTTRIRTDGKDILHGDRIFAFFDSIPRTGVDTLRSDRIREIRAMGNASSLFHMASSRGPDARAGVNYVRGERIVVDFDTGVVRTVRVDSKASGVYLEPIPDSLSDSTGSTPVIGPPSTRPDTTSTTSSWRSPPGPGSGDPGQDVPSTIQLGLLTPRLWHYWSQP